jgi:hypothetical protein
MKKFKLIKAHGTNARVEVTINPPMLLKLLGFKKRVRIATTNNFNNVRKWCWEDTARTISGEFLGPRLSNACKIYAVKNPDKSKDVYMDSDY